LHLRIIEPAVTFMSPRWDNLMEGHAYGVEPEASLQLTS
jgi:hypothetical protein